MNAKKRLIPTTEDREIGPVQYRDTKSKMINRRMATLAKNMDATEALTKNLSVWQLSAASSRLGNVNVVLPENVEVSLSSVMDNGLHVSIGTSMVFPSFV